MEKIVDLMKGMPGYIGGYGVSIDEINEAEELLSVVFAADYKSYLMSAGLACVANHELTGICDSDRLNVVVVTKTAKEQENAAQAGWYVIEQANIDGIMIWQDAEGKVYQTQPGMQPIQIADSLLAYLQAV